MNYWRYPVVGYFTNFGNCYCAAHKPDADGKVGDKLISTGWVAETVDIARPIRGDDNCAGTPCDYPGCGAVLPPRDPNTRELVNMSLMENMRP